MIWHLQCNIMHNKKWINKPINFITSSYNPHEIATNHSKKLTLLLHSKIMCTNARSKQLDYPSFIMLKSCIHMLHTVQHRPPLRKCTLPLISKKQPAIPLKKKIKSLIYLYSSIVTKIPWTDHFWLGSYKLSEITRRRRKKRHRNKENTWSYMRSMKHLLFHFLYLKHAFHFFSGNTCCFIS